MENRNEKWEIKNSSKTKNSLNRIDRLDAIGQKIGEIKGIAIGTTQYKAEREKKTEKEITWETVFNSLA